MRKDNTSEQRTSDKLTMIEIFILIIIFVCYIGTIYFACIDNRVLFLLFFVLHSCFDIVFLLVFHDKMTDLSLTQTELAVSQLSQTQLSSENTASETAALKKTNEALISEKEDLLAQCLDYKNRIEELKEALEKSLAEKSVASKAADLNHLLPARENPVELDIIACASNAIDEMTPYSQASGIQLLLSSASNSLIVRADATFMHILFRNIIDNSIKYMQRNGSLVITISSIGDDLFIVLKDNGQGLSSQETDHIFELNYQGSNRISGNGLGLTQAKAIVEYYGGTIYAKSGSGKGMGIYIQLPSKRL